jgi:3-hydroxybutyryl-CoA dehydrogenase
MQFIIFCNDDQWQELNISLPENECIRAINKEHFFSFKDADAFFYLMEDAADIDFSAIVKPIFINAVSKTLAEINGAKNVFRINGWATFLQRNTWEVVGDVDENITTILSALNKKIIVVPDEVGMVAARVVAMIINEAYFALQDEVSTKNEIDIAMKLGTNYPYGPFEWATKIGIKNIYQLLKKLSDTDGRYKPAQQLINELTPA